VKHWRERLRAERDRDAKRKTSKTAKCAAFLREGLADQPVSAAQIMQQAVALGLEPPEAKQFG
jgi:hypothetical protein